MTSRYYNETTKVFIEEKKYKGLIAHTNARTQKNTFSYDYFYHCHYFPPHMHLSEILRLHVQVRAVGSG